MYNDSRLRLDAFIKSNFDINDSKIVHKLEHTFRVVDNTKYICEDLNLSEEDKEIALLIALLHDFGRFEQAKEYQSFREDLTNIDHAALGVKLLFDYNLIRKFVDVDKYDFIIKTAIANHGKYIFDETGMSEKEILHSRIIRDADKLDSFRSKASSDIYTMANIKEEDIENSLISDNIYEDFMNEKTILSKDRKTGIDIWISYIAFVFGLFFNSSIKIIRKNNYIDVLIDRFTYNIPETKIKMEELRKKANDYIDDKLN